MWICLLGLLLEKDACVFCLAPWLCDRRALLFFVFSLAPSPEFLPWFLELEIVVLPDWLTRYCWN